MLLKKLLFILIALIITYFLTSNYTNTALAQSYSGNVTHCGISVNGSGQIIVRITTSEVTSESFSTNIKKGGTSSTLIPFSQYTRTSGSPSGGTSVRTITLSSITAPAGTYGMRAVGTEVNNFCSVDDAFTIDGSGSITINVSGGPPPPTVGQAGENPCGNPPVACETAFGNIPVDATRFTQRITDIALGLAGGIALIIMVVGSIKILMASGDQEKIAKGRDMLIAAVAGLLFLIFSVLILKFIGSDLLGLGTPFSP